MFRIENINDGILINVELPQGKSNEELVKAAIEEIEKNKEKFYGKSVYFNGRITTAMSFAIGHRIAHIARDVYVFIPMENKYVKVIWH